MNSKSYLLQTDGGSRGNPGPAAAGWVIKQNSNNSFETIVKNSKYLGIKTNNFAEYTAIVEGLKECIEHKITDLKVEMDSELAVKQINGLYKIKNPQIKIFCEEIMLIKKQFKNISFSHVYREYNKEADGMVNECLDKKKNETHTSRSY